MNMLKFISYFLLVFSYSLLANTIDENDEKFDTRFLIGNPEYADFFNSESDLFVGTYLVELYVNQQFVKDINLTIDPFEYELNELCLEKNLLIGVDKSYYNAFRDIKNDCYFIGREQYTKADLSIDNLSLELAIPQSYFSSTDKKEGSAWEQGNFAVRSNYFANISKSNNGSDPYYFANLDMKVNALGWYGQLDSYLSQDRLDISSLIITTAVEELDSELTLGQTWTGNSIHQSFGFVGLQLASDYDMKPNSEKRYSPVVTGVSEENATITISQSGVVVYQTRLSPGPYRLEDLRPVSNGDLIIEIEGDSGKSSVETVPMSVLPQMVRPGVFEYDLSVGFVNSSFSDINKHLDNDRLFMSYNFSRGLDDSTVLGSSVLSDGYFQFGAKYMQPLGYLGTIGLTVSRSQSKDIEQQWISGYSFKAEYARSITSDVDFNLLSYRYQNKDYVDFSDYQSTKSSTFNSKEKYEARLSSRFDQGSISSSMWKESNWEGIETMGLNLTGSVTIGENTISLSSNFRDAGLSDISLSLTVPLDYSFSKMASFSSSYSAESGELFSSASSAINIDEDLSMFASVDRSVNGVNVSVNSSIKTDKVNYSIGFTGDDESNLSVKSSVSGSVLYTNNTGIILSTVRSNTIGIIDLDGLAGVKVKGTSTNTDGFAVVPISPYRENYISIDSNNISGDIEISSSSVIYKPLKNSVLYRNIGYSVMRKYNIIVENSDEFVSMNNLDIVNDRNESVGYMYQGMIVAAMKETSEYLSVSVDGVNKCTINLNDINANADTIYKKECQ